MKLFQRIQYKREVVNMKDFYTGFKLAVDLYNQIYKIINTGRKNKNGKHSNYR